MSKPLRLALAISSLVVLHRVSAQWQVVVTDTNVWALEAIGDTLLLGTYDGFLYFSPDLGATWQDRTGTMPNNYIENVGVAAGNKLVCTNGSAVWMSSDWNTWMNVRSIGTSATCMVVNDSVILAGGEMTGGLHASFDLGASWSQIGSGQANQYSTSVSYRNDTIQWSRFNGDVLLSPDNGSTWSPIPALGTDIFTLEAQGDHAGSNTNIHRRVGNGWVSEYLDTQILDIALSGMYLAACGAANGPNGYVFLSDDAGASWVPVPSPNSAFQMNKVAITGDYLYAGNPTGLYRLQIHQFLGLEEGTDTNPVLIHPNPASDRITITVGSFTEGATVRLFNASGQLARTAVKQSGTSTFDLDTAGLPSGVYHVVFTGNGVASAHRVMISD
jgi:Secretion system C-terminal sorting domain